MRTQLAAIPLMFLTAGAAMPAAASAQSAAPAQSPSASAARPRPGATGCAASAVRVVPGERRPRAGIANTGIARLVQKPRPISSGKRSIAANPRLVHKLDPTSVLLELLRDAGPGIEETLRNMPGTVIEIGHPPPPDGH